MRGYLIENQVVAVKQCRHGVFMFNRHDRLVGRSLDCYGEWCETELDLLLRFCRHGDVVVDVGANIGSHTLAFAKAVGDSGEVVALEPQRLPFQILCGNVALNGLSNVRVLQQGAGDRSGSAVVPLVSGREPHNWGAVSLGAEGSPGEPIDVVPVDGLGLKSCRLIKIDVEGMEPRVIRGAANSIRRFQPILFVENNTVEQSSATIAAILETGYRAWWHLGLYYNRKNFFNNEVNVFGRYKPEANMFCAPPGADPGVPELIECVGVEDNWEKARDRGIAARNPLFFP